MPRTDAQGLGGSVEPGEDYPEGALRELEEETGIKSSDIEEFRMIGLFTFKGGKGTYWENGYEIGYFDATYSHADLPPCNEGDISWVGLDQLDSLDILDDTKAAIELFKEEVFGKVIESPYVGEFLESGRGCTDTILLAN
ncbi:MAG: NUDIX hydrolase [Candidatus Dojkabacteria bacterium]|nr:MAG: NUDIX hydrolase [Candidatus Dojkabacteria bacterium]